jgi:hypothetical protein
MQWRFTFFWPQALFQKAIMHLPLKCILVLFVACLPAHGQLIKFVAQGTLDAGSVGGPFGSTVTADYQLNLADATVASSGTGYKTYDFSTPNSGSVTFSSGSISVTQTNIELTIYSGVFGEYGYILESFGTPTGYVQGTAFSETDLLGTSSAIAPTSSLSSIMTSPIADFTVNGSVGFEGTINNNGTAGQEEDFNGSPLTSFSVAAVPEPKTSDFLLAALAFLVCLGLRKKLSKGLAPSDS